MKLLEGLKIVVLGLVGAISYGIVHDMITAHFCVEYFTIGHPDIFHTKVPFLLALGWGVVATWWVGLPLGALLAAAARSGTLPPLTWCQLLRPTIWVLAINLILALASGAAVYVFSTTKFGLESLNVLPEHDHRFFAVLVTHNASYILGAIGGLVLCGWAIRIRVRLSA